MRRFKRRDFLVAVPSGSMFRSNTITVSLQCKQNKLIKNTDIACYIKTEQFTFLPLSQICC